MDNGLLDSTAIRRDHRNPGCHALNYDLTKRFRARRSMHQNGNCREEGFYWIDMPEELNLTLKSEPVNLPPCTQSVARWFAETLAS
jgi:hypothetical protein